MALKWSFDQYQISPISCSVQSIAASQSVCERHHWRLFLRIFVGWCVKMVNQNNFQFKHGLRRGKTSNNRTEMHPRASRDLRTQLWCMGHPRDKGDFEFNLQSLIYLGGWGQREEGTFKVNIANPLSLARSHLINCHKYIALGISDVDCLS